MTPIRNPATMTCPVCHAGLQPMVREGIEIDYCPQCRGVWLDRGELDKIIEREAGLISGAPQTRPQPPAQTRPPGYHEPPPPGYYDQNYSRRRDHDDDDDDDDDHGKHYGRRKKRGLFGELFDFG